MFKNHNIKKNSRKHAVVFVHGLNGSQKTWIEEKKRTKSKRRKTRFINKLQSKPEIENSFGLYTFQYFTKIFYPNWIARILSIAPNHRIWSLMKGFNLSNRQNALILKSHLQGILDKYDTITLVGHSMGGLIAKHAMIELDSQIQKIPYFFSLSVPHRGSILGSIGSRLKFFGVQVDQLNAFSEYTADLNERYSKLQYKPRIIYQRGAKDLVVAEDSAVMQNNSSDLVIHTNDNHFSILIVKGNMLNRAFQELERQLITLKDLFIPGALTLNPINLAVPEDWTFEALIKTLCFNSLVNCPVTFIGFDQCNSLNKVPARKEFSGKNLFETIKEVRDCAERQGFSFKIDPTDSQIIITKDE